MSRAGIFCDGCGIFHLYSMKCPFCQFLGLRESAIKFKIKTEPKKKKKVKKK